MEDDYQQQLTAEREARIEVERKLKDVEHQLQQEKTRSNIKEENFRRAKQTWDEDEEAFKKRISQLEWTEEMYSLLQSEKEAKDRELLEFKEAFEELEKERVEAVRKTVQEERVRAKEESAAVENFLGKILDENQELQQQVAEMPSIAMLNNKIIEAEVDRDIHKKSVVLYKEFFDFVRHNNCLNHQGHTQWGITSHKIKCAESSREARLERAKRSQAPPVRDDRHSYIPRTGSESELLYLSAPKNANGLPPRAPISRTSSGKKNSSTSPPKNDVSSGCLGALAKRVEDAEAKTKEVMETLTKERERLKELEIRWKAVCSKKEKDLADARQKIARLQVEAAASGSGQYSSCSSPKSFKSTSDLEDAFSAFTVFGKEPCSPKPSPKHSFLAAEKEVDIKDLQMQVATYKTENQMLADELASEKEARRKFEFERSSEIEEMRANLVECQKLHQEKINSVQEGFDNEKAVVWSKYQELLVESQQTSHDLGAYQRNFELIQSTFGVLLKTMDPVRFVVADLFQDVRLLGNRGKGGAAGHEDASLVSRRPFCYDIEEQGVESLVEAMEELSEVLRSCAEDLENIRARVHTAASSNNASGAKSVVSSVLKDEGEEVAQVTVKLDWITPKRVQVLETDKNILHNKSDPASLYQDPHKAHGKGSDSQRFVESEGIQSPEISTVLSPHAVHGGGWGLCKQCQREMTATDVESALDMAIALGQTEQELNDREHKIAHLEAKILELEGEREGEHKISLRCWEMQSKFDALLTQGKASQLHDELMMTKRLMEHLKQDVKRSCDSIVFELADITVALGRVREETLQSINFVQLAYLRQNLADGASSQFAISSSREERLNAVRLKREMMRRNTSSPKPSAVAKFDAIAPEQSSPDEDPASVLVKAESVGSEEHETLPLPRGTAPVPAQRRLQHDRAWTEGNQLEVPSIPDNDPGRFVENVTREPTEGEYGRVGVSDENDLSSSQAQGIEEVSTSDLEVESRRHEEAKSSHLLLHLQPADNSRILDSETESHSRQDSKLDDRTERIVEDKKREQNLDEDDHERKQYWRVQITVDSAQMATEFVVKPYILLTLEGKGSHSRSEVSKKTAMGGKQVKRDALSGCYEVQWKDMFEFKVAQPDQKFTFTWFDAEKGGGRPEALGYGKMPVSRLLSKLAGPGSCVTNVLSLSNQKLKAVGSITVSAKLL